MGPEAAEILRLLAAINCRSRPASLGSAGPVQPRPRLHLIRFHGVLAPNAKLQALVVPQGPEVQEQATSVALADEREVEIV
jgi:hypothetical protein